LSFANAKWLLIFLFSNRNNLTINIQQIFVDKFLISLGFFAKKH
jgi:hypothetical protein